MVGHHRRLPAQLHLAPGSRRLPGLRARDPAASRPLGGPPRPARRRRPDAPARRLAPGALGRAPVRRLREHLAPGLALPAVPGTEATSLAGGAATSGTDEHALAELPDGRLVTSARDGAYGGTRWTSWSTDGGQTWGELLHADDLPDPGCNAGLVALDDGRLLLSHASSPRARRAGRLSVSEDGGRTWQACAALTGPETPFGYSDLAVLPPAGGTAQVLVVAEHPQPDGPTTLTVLMTAPTRPA